MNSKTAQSAAKFSSDIDLSPESVIFHEGKVVFEIVDAPDEFWVDLGSEVGYVQFCREPIDSNTFLLMRLQTNRTQAPYPVAYIRGVLWSRQAAIEAQKSISAYLAGLAHLS